MYRTCRIYLSIKNSISNYNLSLRIKDQLIRPNKLTDSLSPTSDMPPTFSSSGGEILQTTSLDKANIELNYIQDLIVKLENQQVAESIKYIIDCRKNATSGGIAQY